VSDGADGRVKTGAHSHAAEGAGENAQVAAPARPHYPCFDGLRTIAVLSAIMTHVGFVTGATEQSHHLGEYLAHLEIGPALFFLISGFLLYRPYITAHVGDRAPMRAVPFWWRRALRIFPAYWLALTALIVAFGLPVHGARDVVTYYGLVQIYDTHRFLGGIPQAWTLCTEVSFYAFLPAYAWVLGRVVRGREGRTRLRVEALGAAALIALCYGYRTILFAIDGRHSVGRIAVHWLPGYLDVFGLGMALAVASVWIAMHGSNAIVDWIGRVSWLWWILAAVCYWLVVAHLDLPRSPQPGNTPIGWQADAQQILQSLFALFVTLPAVFGAQDRGLVRRFLQWRPIAYTGLVSYGVYLWHEGWLDKWMQWTHRPNVLQFSATVHLDRTTYPLILGLTVLSSVAVASLSYHFVERPVLALKDRMPRLGLGRPRPARA
jgi:peptidoglycan/LPS O-acetylase OafA/YrhL